MKYIFGTLFLALTQSSFCKNFGIFGMVIKYLMQSKGIQ